MQSGGFWRQWSRSCNGRDIDGHESGSKALPSRYCPETSSPMGNLTLIFIISFSTRCAGQKAGTMPCSNNGWILLANSNQSYFNNLVKTLCHKTPYRCPHRLSLNSQSSRSCDWLKIKMLKDKGLEFANSIRSRSVKRPID